MALSAPRKDGRYRRAVVQPLASGWQVERFTGTQAFHQNLPEQDLAGALYQMLETEFTQLVAQESGWQLRVTQKGKVLTHRMRQPPSAPPAAGHDRPKTRLLPEGQVVPPLVDMGVMTPEGRVIAAMSGKYRQIDRFLELVHHGMAEETPEMLRVIDFGCGKSYLTFLLYHYLTNVRGIRTVMTGLDLKEQVVADCNAAAQKYGYEGLSFAVGDIARHHSDHPVDMVVTLHACDTATDHALAKAVLWQAQMIFSVPCCQHQLNAQMQKGLLPILSRYGIVKERTAALMTDAVRANLLTACGYKAQLVEFVDMEHTPKNIMIRACKAGVSPSARKKALAEVDELCGAFGFAPALRELLREQNALEGL